MLNLIIYDFVDAIAPLLRVSFWEKIGFTDKKKIERNMMEGTQKITKTYNKLKATLKSK